jgi:hypothetical protein
MISGLASCYQCLGETAYSAERGDKEHPKSCNQAIRLSSVNISDHNPKFDRSVKISNITIVKLNFDEFTCFSAFLFG